MLHSELIIHAINQKVKVQFNDGTNWEGWLVVNRDFKKML